MTLAQLLALTLLADAPAALTVRVAGLPSAEAPVRAALFDSKEAWDGGGEPVLAAAIEPTATGCEWRVPELPPGEYALRVFQDLDGDGELDRNELGKPSEPYGFSGGRKGLFGPPGWKKARFTVGAEALVLEVELRGVGTD